MSPHESTKWINKSLTGRPTGGSPTPSQKCSPRRLSSHGSESSPRRPTISPQPSSRFEGRSSELSSIAQRSPMPSVEHGFSTLTLNTPGSPPPSWLRESGSGVSGSTLGRSGRSPISGSQRHTHRSSRHSRTDDRTSQSSRHSPTPTNASGSPVHSRNPGHTSQSSRHSQSAGHSSRVSHHSSKPGSTTQSSRHSRTPGYSSQSSHHSTTPRNTTEASRHNHTSQPTAAQSPDQSRTPGHTTLRELGIPDIESSVCSHFSSEGEGEHAETEDIKRS